MNERRRRPRVTDASKRPGSPVLSGAGIGVDYYGGPIVDPTENVKALTEASVKSITREMDLYARIADEKIRTMEKEWIHQEKIGVLRAEFWMTLGNMREAYQEKIAHAESGRLDSIRQVDREEVAKSAVTANNAITTLAKQTTDLQQTLAKQVTDTAAAQETRYSAQMSDFNKRVSALEFSSSEGRGKQAVDDPRMEKLGMLVEKLVENQAANAGKAQAVDPQLIQAQADLRNLQQTVQNMTGKGLGLNQAWVIGLGIATLLSLMYGFSKSQTPAVDPAMAEVLAELKTMNQRQTQQPPIYSSAPPGTMIPSVPSQSAPGR